MGEIKSTLDLVLEKTRNLTLSEEEKRNIAREELDKKIRGIVGKYMDDLLPLNRIREELESIESSEPDLPYKLFTVHLLAHVDLDVDISAILSALKEVVGSDPASLEVLQQEYKADKETARRSFAEDNLSALKERGVSGSAVVPNLDGIPEWVQFLSELSERYWEKIGGLGEG
ncbi:MAG: hypothetical protein JSV55_08785 [Deltaproteobacteria bacterium]|nr:MAG: hypothetical protein JSV55_08785 [Deltaproteobacteria bacterium]